MQHDVTTCTDDCDVPCVVHPPAPWLDDTIDLVDQEQEEAIEAAWWRGVETGLEAGEILWREP